MNGYESIKEYIQDQELLVVAKEIGTVKRGMHIEKLMKERIKKKKQNQTNKFKKELQKNKYTELDLKLLSVNKKSPESLEEIYVKLFGKEQIKIDKVKKIIKSESYKQGKLYKIYRFIPSKIDSARKLRNFLKSWQSGITELELNTILKLIGEKENKEWFEKYLDKEHYHKHRGRYFF